MVTRTVHKWILAALLAVVSSPSSLLASTQAGTIGHNPVARAQPDEPLVIEVRASDPDAMSQLRLRYRSMGGQAFQSAEFARLESGVFVADIPASALRSPGIEYYLAGETGPLAGARFASASAPHRVYVGAPSVDQRMEERLRLYDGRRSRFSAGASFVSYGPSSSLDREAERYHALDADFTYRFLATLESLRFGAVRLRGFSASDANQDEAPRPVGYDFGFAEIWLSLRDSFGVVAELQLGANQEQFTVGGTLGLRLGPDTGTSLLLWGGATALVGARGGLKLSWDTVPRVPMAACIEITSWPDNRVDGLRLTYQAEVPFANGISLLPELSYGARSAKFGRLGGGLRLAYAY